MRVTGHELPSLVTTRIERLGIKRMREQMSKSTLPYKSNKQPIVFRPPPLHLLSRQSNQTKPDLTPQHILAQERLHPQIQPPLTQHILPLPQQPPIDRPFHPPIQLPQVAIAPLDKRDEMIPVRLPLPDLQLPEGRIPQSRRGPVRGLDVRVVVEQPRAPVRLQRDRGLDERGERGRGPDVGARGAVADGVEEGHQAAGMADGLADPEDGFAGAGGGVGGHGWDSRVAMCQFGFEGGGGVSAVGANFVTVRIVFSSKARDLSARRAGEGLMIDD